VCVVYYLKEERGELSENEFPFRGSKHTDLGSSGVDKHQTQK